VSNIPENDEALEYTRRLYQNVLDWYNNADQKAQVIITLAGVIISLSTSFLFFGGNASLRENIDTFGPETIVLLTLFIATISLSIISAIRCLWSRHSDSTSFSFDDSEVSTSPRESINKISAKHMWFFNKIRKLDQNEFCNQLLKTNKEFEVEALANEIYILSKNVTKKHNWVNIGFSMLGISLLLLLIIGANLIVRIKFL
jgi:hypothetical protein